MKSTNNTKFAPVLLAAMIFVTGIVGSGQTNVFTYQGNLKDGANPANGNYDFDVKVFDAASGGNQVAAQGALNVPVSNGTFAFNLGFGASFTGANRWLEVGVKPAGSPNPYTLLTPRQQVW